MDKVKVLNVQGKQIARLDKIAQYHELEILLASQNILSRIPNLTSNLWHLDLACNKIQSLEALDSFAALGTLNLAGNYVTRADALWLQNIAIVNLILLGNPLECDPNYRQRIICMLPNVWFLDGLFVSKRDRTQAAETQQRHGWKFAMTKLKRRLTGKKSPGKRCQLFAKQSPLRQGPAETDLRRVHLAAAELEQDSTLQGTPLDVATAAMIHGDSVKRFMLSLLILGSLQYTIPTELWTGACRISGIDDSSPTWAKCATLFDKPAACRLHVLSILLAANKIDHEEHKEPASTYPSLRTCVHNRYTQELRRLYGIKASTAGARCLELEKKSSLVRSPPKVKTCSGMEVTTEVAQCLAVLPEVAVHFVDTDKPSIGLCTLFAKATGKQDIAQELQNNLRQIFEDNPTDEDARWLLFRSVMSGLIKDIHAKHGLRSTVRKQSSEDSLEDVESWLEQDKQSHVSAVKDSAPKHSTNSGRGELQSLHSTRSLRRRSSTSRRPSPAIYGTVCWSRQELKTAATTPQKLKAEPSAQSGSKSPLGKAESNRDPISIVLPSIDPVDVMSSSSCESQRVASPIPGDDFVTVYATDVIRYYLAGDAVKFLICVGSSMSRPTSCTPRSRPSSAMSTSSLELLQPSRSTSVASPSEPFGPASSHFNLDSEKTAARLQQYARRVEARRRARNIRRATQGGTDIPNLSVVGLPP
eukprot:TRINITY_DN12199_c0_g1_i2.p1 TRINITY_DN12199_c0_g1~~TRINITY_DN12199_c0_g1_i2.p1  ORF type:complete len:700 (+),score=86.25 TRINITY_DN12199_c0_g1_i2:1661-3760(+)